MDRQNDLALLVGRLMLVTLFLVTGVPHLMGGYVGFGRYMGSVGMPAPEIMAIVGTAIEILAPAAIILGVFQRISAATLIAYTLIATLLAHRYWEFPMDQMMNQRNLFFKNLAIVGGLLIYYGTGPGAFALGGKSR